MISNLRLAGGLVSSFLSGIPLMLTVKTILSTTLFDGLFSIYFVLFVSGVLSAAGFAKIHLPSKALDPKSAKQKIVSSPKADSVETAPNHAPAPISGKGYEILPKGSKIAGFVKIGETTQDSFVELDSDCILWLPKKDEGVELSVVPTEPESEQKEKPSSQEEPRFFRKC